MLAPSVASTTGSRRKYTRELLTDVVERASSVAEVLRLLDLNPTGGSHAHISRTIKAFQLDTSHFVRHRNGTTVRRRTASSILVRRCPGSRREKPPLLKRAPPGDRTPLGVRAVRDPRRLDGRPSNLEIDHVDGDYLNNEEWNLRFLCPNCHAQTDNFSGRSRGKYVDATGQLALFATLRPPDT